MPIFLQGAAPTLPITEIIAIAIGALTVLSGVITVLWRRSVDQGAAIISQLETRVRERTDAGRALTLELQRLSTRNDDLVGRLEDVVKDNAALREENAVLRTRLERWETHAISIVTPLPPPSAPARTPTQPSMRLPPIPEPHR